MSAEKIIYTVTNYEIPLQFPRPPIVQRSPITLQTFDSLDNAVNFFRAQIADLATGCVQLWSADTQIGYLYI
jgi:hypothetical protein